MNGPNPLLRTIVVAAFLAFLALLPHTTPAEDAMAEEIAQALALFNSGNYPEAAATYEALIGKYPLSPIASEARFRLAYIGFLKGDYDEALKDYPQGRFTSEAVMSKASALLRLKAHDKAAQTYREFLETEPRRELAAAAEFGLATIFRDIGKPAESIAGFEQIIAKYPNHELLLNAYDPTLQYAPGDIDLYAKALLGKDRIAAFYQGVPSAASEGLWLGGQLLKTQAGTR